MTIANVISISIRPLLLNDNGVIGGPRAVINTARLAEIDRVLNNGNGVSYSAYDALGGTPLLDKGLIDYRRALDRHEAALKPWGGVAYLVYEDERLIAQTPDQSWRYWLPSCSGAYRLLPIDLDALARDGYTGPTWCEPAAPDVAYWRPATLADLHALWRGQR